MSSAVGQVHYGACHLDGRWRLAAGAFSRTPEVNRRTAEAWRVPAERVYDDWRALVANEADRIDAVVVLTPTPDHADAVCALLEAGVPVICEKALAAGPTQVARIRRSFDPEYGFLAVTFNYSGYPMVRELRARIRAGQLGRLHQIHLEMPQEGLVRPPPIAGTAAPPQSWRLVDGEVPTICLDLGVHLHHLAVFLTGREPREVMADFANHSPYRKLVDNVMLWLNFEDDLKGSFWFTKTALGHRNGLRLRVYGDKGSAEWYQAEPEELRLAFHDGTRLTLDRGTASTVCSEPRYNRFKAGHPAGFVEAFANLYADIADALEQHRREGRHDNPYVFGLDHAERGLRLFAAARRSAEERQWQSLAQ